MSVIIGNSMLKITGEVYKIENSEWINLLVIFSIYSVYLLILKILLRVYSNIYTHLLIISIINSGILKRMYNSFSIIEIGVVNGIWMKMISKLKKSSVNLDISLSGMIVIALFIVTFIF